MKKTICIICTFLFIFLCSCSTDVGNSIESTITGEKQGIAELRINGKNIGCDYKLSLDYAAGYAELPLVLIINSLGGTVDWISEREVYITVNNKEYLLNCDELTLYQDGVDFNILALVPGATHRVIYRILDREFIVDSDSIKFFLSLINEEMIIDDKTLTVELKYKEHPYMALFDSIDE